MQITVYPTVSDYARLCTDIDYNIDRGAAMLITKWNATPIIGDGVGNNGHEKLENWYYAIWAYNGFAAINNPNFNNNSYQHKVLGWIANCPNGQWQDCAITAPSNASIGTGYPKQIPVTPSPYHVDANYDGIIDTANVSAKLFISESDVASNPGQEGFFRYGPANWWHDASGIGDGGHMFWTWNNAGHVDNYADWTPTITNSGHYEVFVFVPHANATTHNAHYTVHHADGQTDRYINQYNYNDAWVSLGIYRFNAGTSGYLRLVDQTGERDTTQKVGFDAAQWMAR